jgi:uncharacterized protein
MSQSSNLYRLQLIDTQLQQATNRLNSIDAILNDLSIFEAAEAKAKEYEGILLHNQTQLREIENLVTDQKFKIEQNESTLYSGRIRNPKELQDLQKEVVSLKRYLSVLEDRQLEAMLMVDEAEVEYKAADAETKQVRGRFEEEHAHFRAERSSIVASIESLEIERQAAASMIQTQDHELYEQLRRTRNGVAVARITDRSCSACGSMLTPGLVQSASQATQLARCSSCGRILYVG